MQLAVNHFSSKCNIRHTSSHCITYTSLEAKVQTRRTCINSSHIRSQYLMWWWQVG